MKISHGTGRCTIAANSSLRKRMRAARRGLFPVTVPDKRAMMRHKWYKKKMQALLGELSA